MKSTNTAEEIARRRNTRYVIELSENQLSLINIALEDYFRIELGQTDRLSERLASKGLVLPTDDPDRRAMLFNRYLERRDAADTLLKTVCKIVWPSGVLQKDDDQMVIEDMWSAIKHKLWKDRGGDKSSYSVDSWPPMQLGPEPLISIRKVGERDG